MLQNCNFKCSCTGLAVIAALIIGIVTAFLQITGVIVIAPLFLGAVFVIAIVYLAVLAVAVALARRTEAPCCAKVDTVLAGILGTVLFSLVGLAFGLAATVIGAIVVGLLAAAFTLTVIGTACLIRCLADCT